VIFKQYYLGCLSHASYLVGDEQSGRGVVIDPQRDVRGYLDDAEARGLRIERVIETHIHADFLSGHLELAARTGAQICFGAGADIEFPYEPLLDGAKLALGAVTLRVLATPGHTPESICILVYEADHEDAPYGVLTGDTLFIGDVGRPDLLASSSAGLTSEDLARQLYRSLHRKLLALPDSTRVFPAHGAGSACGKALSSETESTIGEQRAGNYALAPQTEDQFVAGLIEGQPVKPHYFEFDARRNRQLRTLLTEDEVPDSLCLDEVLEAQDQGAVLLDTREPIDFAAGHLRGAVNVGLQGRFAEFAGNVVAPDARIVLVGNPAAALETKVRLARIGFDHVIGQLDDPGAVFVDRPDLGEASSRVTMEQLAERLVSVPELVLVDVRGPGETASGLLTGAIEIPLPVLVDFLDALDPSRPTVVYCAGGYRSSIAASVMRAAGFADASDLVGGYAGWSAAGLPVTTLHHSPHDALLATPAYSSVPEVDPLTAEQLAGRGAILLDVREPEEWEAGHVAGARLLPMGQVQDRAQELPARRQIVTICRVGGRSAAITEALNGLGFDAVNLAGGMRAWAAAGLPIVTEDGDPGIVT
jgi:rhodanese-related sulfurtransferase/glyoxylase-like metal-dependent hydrolase (beta-lactamase superfamily II)